MSRSIKELQALSLLPFDQLVLVGEPNEPERDDPDWPRGKIGKIIGMEEAEGVWQYAVCFPDGFVSPRCWCFFPDEITPVDP